MILGDAGDGSGLGVAMQKKSRYGFSCSQLDASTESALF